MILAGMDDSYLPLHSQTGDALSGHDVFVLCVDLFNVKFFHPVLRHCFHK